LVVVGEEAALQQANQSHQAKDCGGQIYVDTRANRFHPEKLVIDIRPMRGGFNDETIPSPVVDERHTSLPSNDPREELPSSRVRICPAGTFTRPTPAALLRGMQT